MRSEIHPISGALYEELGDGKVRVTKAKKLGVFDWQGHHIEGNMTYADPHLLQWVGGPELPAGIEAGDPRQRIRNMQMQQTARAAEAQYAGGTALQGASEEGFTRYTGDPGRDTPKGKRSLGISFHELLEGDSFPERIPDTLRLDSPMTGGVTKVSTDRYWKQEIHDLEVEKIWKRVWQMACHVDDIPEIGDYIVYDVAHLSYLVARQTDGSIKAFNNACLHRGRLLREFDGKTATEFRCAFHGWSWEIDGKLREIPSEWDFPEVRKDVGTLREVKVGLWGGFVFINPDPNSESLEAFLGDLPKHYEKYDYEKKYKQAHVAKIVPANWKANQEAFMEGYHIVATHPQLMVYGGDGANHQYDVFGNWCRAVTVAARTSAHRNVHPPKDEVFASRKQIADSMRENLRGVIGDRVDVYCDSELIDGQYNNLFPNFHPWGAFSRIVYRFRPYGSNPEKSIMEIIYMAPWPDGEPKPPAAQIHWLSEEDNWTDAPEMGGLARVINQDSYNLPKVQAGMKAKVEPWVNLAAYEEGKVRHFHHLWDEWMARE
ncbi:MAG: aromatic ring-hydroxylating dioxygenase subunit alpha [Dehalococcoidia bacterium]